MIRNDLCTVEEIQDMDPAAIFLSPGPRKLSDAGICIDVVRGLSGKILTQGVCLGHQAIRETYEALSRMQKS